jgi:hypothetical protein
MKKFYEGQGKVLGLSPDGRFLAVGEGNPVTRVRLHDTANPGKSHPCGGAGLPLNLGPVGHVVFGPARTGTLLVVSHREGFCFTAQDGHQVGPPGASRATEK